MLDLIRIGGAAVFLAIYGSTELTWLQFLGLYSGISWGLRATFSLAGRSRWGHFAPPAYMLDRLPSALSGFVTALAFLPSAESALWQLALVALAVGTAYTNSKLILLACQSAYVLARLDADLRAGRSPRTSPPYVLLAGTFKGRSGTSRTLGPWLLTLATTLWKTRHQGETGALPPWPEAPASGVRHPEAVRLVWARLKQRTFARVSIATFVTTEEVSRLDETHAAFVMGNAAAMIAIADGRLRRALAGLSAEQEGLLLDAIQSGLEGTVFSRLGTRLRDGAGKTDGRLHHLLHHAPGPVFLLAPSSGLDLGDDEAEAGQAQRMLGYEVVEAKRADVFSTATPRVVDVLAKCALPITRSDRRLRPELRETIAALGAEGLAPLADSYMRFRLSTSAVERVLGLFDCFEALIKYSVFALAVPTGGALLEQLARPSLGTWVQLLRERLVMFPGQEESALRQALAGFWNGPLEAAPRELIEATNGAGMAWRDKVPRSHLAWLGWLVWLRNSTKGHGGMAESLCVPVWHDFHATFLTAVSRLAPLTLESSLWASTASDSPVEMRGWLRGPFRSSTLGSEPSQQVSDACFLGYGDAAVDLSPLVRFEGNVCLTWNSGDSRRAQYIDYSSGRLATRTGGSQDGATADAGRS